MIYLYIFIMMMFSWGVSYIAKDLPKGISGILLCVISCLMIVVSATRPDTGVSDMSTYEDMFVNYDDLKFQLSVEPTYLWLSEFIISIGGGFRVILWVYAIMAIPVKLYAFKRLTSYEVLFTSLPVYLSFFYLMHDCEQIRLAAAASFTMMAYVYKVEERKWYIWAPIWLCGILFHYSSFVAIFPLLFTPSKAMGWIWRTSLAIIVVMGVVIWALKINVFSYVPIPGFEAKMALYELAINKGDQLETIPLLYPVALLRYITFFAVLFLYDYIHSHVRALNIILISNAIGLFAWGGLSGVAVFAVRISEFFQITEGLLFASVIFAFRPVWVGKLYPFVTSIVILLYGMLMVNQFGYI